VLEDEPEIVLPNGPLIDRAGRAACS